MGAEMNGNGHQEEVEAQPVDLLQDLGIEISFDMAVDLRTLSAAEVMKLRGTLLAVSELMSGSMVDLMSSIRSGGDERMRAMVGLYAMGGSLTVQALIETVDQALADSDLPVVSLYEVESSNLAALGWAGDPDSVPMAVVEFQNGGLYAYEGVSESVFQEWWQAPSRGEYLSQRIKGQYGFVKLVG